jgi:hypothetical protein
MFGLTVILSARVLMYGFHNIDVRDLVMNWSPQGKTDIQRVFERER